MDRKHFLDSQLWLRHLPVTAMDKLRANFTFYAILTDAICCFQVEKSLVFFASGSPGDGHHASPDDATQLDLQVLLCLCEEAENKSEGEQQSVPALFFVLDGQSYIVNHTLISRISFPQTFSGSSEPPSAFLGWPGVQMRWWLDASIAANIAFQQLSLAIGTMNKLLLPAILTHRAIDEVKLNRQKCRPVASNATSSLHAHAVAAPRSLDNGILTKAAMTHSLHESRAATISSSSGSKAVKKRTRTTLEDEERSSSRIIVGESPCDTLLSCYNNWMDFVEIASELVAAEVSEDSVCDSFLRIKSGSSRGQHATALALTTTSDSTVSCLAVSNALSDKCIHMSDGINDSASVNSSSTREPSYSALQSPGKELSGGTSNLAADNRKQETARTETSSSRKQKRDVVSQYNDAASAFVCGILSIDEATLCDEYLLAQSTSKESAIQELLQDLYPIPQGRGYGVHSDTAPEEIPSDGDRLLSIESLLLQMSEISENIAVLKAIPRAIL